MNILATTFSKKGATFEQLDRVGDVAIYRRSKRATGFEVIKVQSHNGYEIAGKTIPPGESYPPTSSWGTHGWTFQTEEKAREKFNALLAGPVTGKQST